MKSDTFGSNIKISYEENVPFETLQKELLNNYFFVLPTQGENFGHAIFESFAAGRPVIISDQTPWRNLESHLAGFDIPLSAPEKFVEAIDSAAKMDQTEYDKWCKGAYDYAQKFVKESNLKEKYLKLFS